ncbi:hypothetical protein JCM12294_18690 [Desulfocicer niacini]
MIQLKWNWMARLQQQYEQQGFYGIGLVNCVKGVNVGTLWRSAYILGASFIFTVGKPYRREAGDVTLTWQKIPLYNYTSVDVLKEHLPFDTRLVGVELSPDAQPLSLYDHPKRAVYLLGNEQVGLPPDLLSACHGVVRLPGEFSLNVSVAGSLVMYDRITKIDHALPRRKA